MCARRLVRWARSVRFGSRVSPLGVGRFGSLVSVRSSSVWHPSVAYSMHPAKQVWYMRPAAAQAHM